MAGSLARDFRVNIDQGSRVIPWTLTPREKRTAARLSKHLRSRRIRLAAVDLIDARVTDLNFTSPGLIVQMEKVTGLPLAETIVKRLLTS